MQNIAKFAINGSGKKWRKKSQISIKYFIPVGRPVEAGGMMFGVQRLYWSVLQCTVVV